ncbi:MAG: hypothetical protein IT245_07520 [Bacteroidia bacterium]|nr:hypothetical protein [Bacteroidia bacterium]
MSFSFRLLVLYLTLSSFVGPTDLAQFRSLYLKSESDSKSADNLLKLTKDKSDAISVGYRGAAWSLKAKHHFYPGTKLDYLKKGLNDLNQSIKLNSTEVELRFLRFSVEENIPSIVSFTSHLEEDKTFIVSNLKSNHGFYSTIKSYMLKSDQLSASEKAKLK